MNCAGQSLISIADSRPWRLGCVEMLDQKEYSLRVDGLGEANRVPD
jgi:hypothetical protein